MTPASPPLPVLHGVGSRAFVASLLQALPPTGRGAA